MMYTVLFKCNVKQHDFNIVFYSLNYNLWYWCMLPELPDITVVYIFKNFLKCKMLSKPNFVIIL